jgi:hypothetical protein
MDITTFMIAVYCLIDDFLCGRQLRARGPQPTLRDSEVLTMEVVGEFLGIDTESNLFTHFRRHYADWFPGIRQITRTTFTRQAANLWKVKQELWQVVAQAIPQDPYISIVDSFPVPVCRFARAPRCRCFGEVAAFGHDEVARQTYYGFRAHVRLAGCPGGLCPGSRQCPRYRSGRRRAARGGGICAGRSKLLETGTFSALTQVWALSPGSLQICQTPETALASLPDPHALPD